MEGAWVWEPDGHMFIYSNFAQGRPNNYLGENCLSKEHGHSYKWDDDDCDSHRSYFCEKPAWVPKEFLKWFQMINSYLVGHFISDFVYEIIALTPLLMSLIPFNELQLSFVFFTVLEMWMESLAEIKTIMPIYFSFFFFKKYTRPVGCMYFQILVNIKCIQRALYKGLIIGLWISIKFFYIQVMISSLSKHAKWWYL